MRRTVLLALVTACLLPAPSFADEPAEIARMQRVGPVHIGMKAHELLKLLGKPRNKSKLTVWAATGEEMTDWRFPERGLTVSLSRKAHELESELTVEDFTVDAPSHWKTPAGVGLQSTTEQVRKAYGKHVDPSENGPDEVMVGSVYGGLVFRLRQGRVYEIFVGAAAE